MGYGMNPQSAQPGPSPAPRKEPFFSLLASFFIPGLGTILNGQTRKGVLFMATFYVGPIVIFVVTELFFSFLFQLDLLGLRLYVFYARIFAIILLALGTWFWGLLDAYRGAEAHNARNGLH